MRIQWDHYYREMMVEAAKEMAVAARTAPKARGRDQLHILILTEGDKDAVAERMREIGVGEDIDFFRRDAENVLAVPVLLILGTEVSPTEVRHCGYCGWADCSENRERGTNPCAFTVGDLGIAVGSAASLAARRHVDNRVMFSAGKAALELGLFPSTVKVALGIPLSATGKNPFFDRARKG
ncbi:MAG: ferredoxin [bacterium]|nr:MAG: ferredoxin [bacterium]